MASAINPFLGMAVNFGLNTFGSAFANNVVNAHLTGKEREQNAWNAEQAQIARDYQTEMSNTAWQRGVADMQAAGLNPALAYGQGGASTPTGSNAQGSASVVSPMDVMSMAMQMKMMQTEIGLKKSQERLNDAKANESSVNAAQIVEMTENIKAERSRIIKSVEGLDLDNKQKSIIYTYADERERASLSNLKADTETKRKQVDLFNSEIEKLGAEAKKTAQETINLVEQLNLMMSQETLNYAQAEQCGHMISQIDQNVEMLKKDNAHYDWNHMKTLSFKDGVAVVSGANGEYAGSFTGVSAAVRPKSPQRNAERNRSRAENRSEAFKRNGYFR